jgi:Lon protease-like protein
MAEHGVELPIFELPAVLLPGELMPLHIFEERYKRMIGHCLEAEEPFGIVFRDDDGSARRIGCEARVTDVLERFEDGRMNIVVSGERPFRVLDRFEAPDYPAGEVEPIDSDGLEADEVPDAEETDEDAARTARDAFAELVEQVSGEPPDAEELAIQSSYDLAARVELPAETKQILLESRSEPQRMRILGSAFGALLHAMERSQEIAERARMNGKVIFGDHA